MSKFVVGTIKVECTFRQIVGLFRPTEKEFTKVFTVNVRGAANSNFENNIQMVAAREIEIAKDVYHEPMEFVGYKTLSTNLEDMENVYTLREMMKALSAKDFCDYLKEKGIAFTINIQ